MQQAEDYFDSVMETAVDEFRQFEEEMEREAKAELSGIDDTAEKVKKMGDLMEKGANIASKLYIEAVMKSPPRTTITSSTSITTLTLESALSPHASITTIMMKPTRRRLIARNST
ncbi:hypothetical protein GOBAR_AA07099 [Gossypium barbadense]|uniref:Uncharacterized protein n=2 Tax=Gossypium TaxID=3633 RepID=A0A2P5YCY5_GOSBA|nr:hypothetical protein GOBAR_AA07099 [Gossypium barbadense]TYH14427.1 hypothetical protein ES288_A06G219800v1 [Gossypium darwinii]TYH14428.1 hypothetical protein ES288_A06G219800v1 [Gossypium darwinii]